MTSPPPIRILLVDDHYLVRVALKQIIGSEPGMTVVAEAQSGEEAVALYAREMPEVVIMDLRLGGMNGIETTSALRARDPGARILILSTFSYDEDIYRALEAGALGYLTKSARHEELLHAIRTVAAGRRHIPPEVGERLAERVGGEELSPREREVLVLMADGNRNKEIADRLGIAEGTVKLHVSRILGKLGVQDRTKAISVAAQRGIIRIS